ncbi:MAG: flagellar basal-body MS-ring/collar protein FliF [Gammaproteobacteria bacterium]|nr:flagellar basal-body MS-ring/collar protein FliF [Gammaproteobacteria bacterium]
MAEVQGTQALPSPVGNPNAWRGLLGLSALRQMGLLVALAATIALGVSIALWTAKADYALLYGGLSPGAASEVLEALDATGVPYRLDERNNSIMVPADKVYDVRFRLAAQNLPGGGDMGFEILQEEQSFGTSQFVERARFQRALEVELGRSISTVNGVRSARVHLAQPRESAFVRERRPPTASVLLTLTGMGKLGEGQVSAVAHMVAAAVPRMEPGNVKVVDQRGRLLTRPEADSALAMSSDQLDYVNKLEQGYVRRIQDILRPVVGLDGLEAQVSADVDFTRTEQTREIYNPDLPALRSEQVLEEQGAAGAAGIPGALANQPPGAGAAPEQAAGVEGAAGGAGESSRRRSTRNFELDKTIRHTVMPSAVLRRLSVAVVVDDHRTAAADGTVQRQALTPEETARIETLVKEAIGFTQARGDRVQVTNVSFTEPLPAPPVEAQPLWEQSWVLTLSKQVLGVLLVLFLILGVLRPAMRRLTGADAELRDMQAKLEATMTQRGHGQRQDDDGVVRQVEGDDEVLQLPDTATHERRLEVVRKLVQDDPKRVAQVVRDWVNADG